MQEVLSVSNDVAAELATVGDGVLDALRDRLRCTILLRGNRLTIEGSDPDVAQARAVIDELRELVEGGHEIEDRKSTRLNSSHSQISYAVFCLKKKKNTQDVTRALLATQICY